MTWRDLAEDIADLFASCASTDDHAADVIARRIAARRELESSPHRLRAKRLWARRNYADNRETILDARREGYAAKKATASRTSTRNLESPAPLALVRAR